MSFYTARAWKNKTDQARACKSSLNQTSINGLTKKKKKKPTTTTTTAMARAP